MELRKDYILPEWVIISTARSKRPTQFGSKEVKKSGTDFFAPGNEDTTPPEIGRIADGDSWKIRWFDNKFPFLHHDHSPESHTHNEYYTFAEAFGYHQVIVETPGDEQIWDLEVDHLKELFEVYAQRIKELSELDNIKYVAIFKNHGKEAGCSIVHAHTQLAALPLVPPRVQMKCDACKDKDHYQEIIEKEKNSDRRCFENDSFIAFTPYASRANYEIRIVAKNDVKTFEDFEDHDFVNLSEIMKQILTKLKEINAPFNFYIHYAPTGENLRFHIELTPRMSTWAGFELSSGIIVNGISPEDAAKFYRGEVQAE